MPLIFHEVPGLEDEKASIGLHLSFYSSLGFLGVVITHSTFPDPFQNPNILKTEHFRSLSFQTVWDFEAFYTEMLLGHVVQVFQNLKRKISLPNI